MLRLSASVCIDVPAAIVWDQFLGHGMVADRLVFTRQIDWRGAIGLALIVYATVIYGVLGYALGHAWPNAPVFGVAPCPTTIFTFGVLMLATRAAACLAGGNSSHLGRDWSDSRNPARRAGRSWPFGLRPTRRDPVAALGVSPGAPRSG